MAEVRYGRGMHNQIVHATIGSGVVEGFTRDGVNRWRAIPYAQPPVGALRFRAPRPATPWRGVRHCHSFGYCAPQEPKYTAVGVGRFQPMSEDCLTLNVTAPQHASPDAALPVMVFVHGGGYVLGSSATPLYDGAPLVLRGQPGGVKAVRGEGGCVYVSVNYRLGPLGCMDLSSLSEPNAPIDSNLFLRDLVLALQWVRDNIAVFGGDPDKVTIFGESAGAHAVATLLAVPAAKGLFARVIAESPASGMVRSSQSAAAFAAKFASILGARHDDAAAVVKQARPAELGAALLQLVEHGLDDMAGSFPVGPTYGDDYLPVEPTEAMRTGQAHRVPLIVGTNDDEGRLFTRFLKYLPTNEPMITQLLSVAEPEVRQRITDAYPGYPRADACIRLGGDFAFGTAAWQIAEAHSSYAPTYMYRYDYAPRTLQWSGLGATHATELLAVFDVYRSRFGGLLTAAADRRSAQRVSDDVQSRWLVFGRDGAPGADWPLYTSDERAVMVFDRRSRVELDPSADRRKAWEGFSLLTPS